MSNSQNQNLKAEILTQFKELVDLFPLIQETSIRCLQQDISRECIQQEVPNIQISNRLKLEKEILKDIGGVFQGKWMIDVLFTIALLGEPHFNDLLKAIPKIGSRILTTRLKQLESRKIIVRNVVTSQPVRVTYSLSEFGLSFIALMFPVILHCLTHNLCDSSLNT